MRRGSISLGEITCDMCGRLIPNPERYLATDEEGGEIRRYCVACCLKKGYAEYREEKGEKIATFFPEKEKKD